MDILPYLIDNRIGTAHSYMSDQILIRALLQGETTKGHASQR